MVQNTIQKSRTTAIYTVPGSTFCVLLTSNLTSTTHRFIEFILAILHDDTPLSSMQPAGAKFAHYCTKEKEQALASASTGNKIK